jgi:hypothetical protein
LKTVFATIIVAAVTQAIICRISGLEYSGTIDGLLTIEWLIGSLFLGFNAPNQRMAFFGSVGLSVPPISYSMVGYGLLEMGGFFHAFSFGAFGLVIYKIIQHFKIRKSSCNSAF